jgi:hypothetical protein
MTSKLVWHCNTMWSPQDFVIFHGMKKKSFISVIYFPKLAMIENQFKSLFLQNCIQDCSKFIIVNIECINCYIGPIYI